MRPVEGKITTDFFEKRPLSKPVEERDHVHGALDISARAGEAIKMPEDGAVWAWCAFRPESGIYWPELPNINGMAHWWANYFYDTFGGVLIIYAADGTRTHIIAHSYQNQLFNKGIYRFGGTMEEKEDKQFPIHGIYSETRTVREGEIIGYVGNAGYSTGPHIHWEIHKGTRWNRWENRTNPEKWRKE